MLEFVKLARQLQKIPMVSPERAAKILKRTFKSRRRGLKVLNEAGIVVAYNRDEEERLFRLCSELAERYYVAVDVPHHQKASHVSVEFSYSQLFKNLAESRLDRAKLFLGGRPTAVRIHTPWAKLSNSFEFFFQAPPGWYIYYQRLMSRKEPTSSDTANIGYFGRKAKAFGKERKEEIDNLEVDSRVGINRSNAGWSLAHIFVSRGRRAKGHLDIGLRVLEIPAGSMGLAVFTSLVSCLAAIFIVSWFYLVGDEPIQMQSRASDIPALILALTAGLPSLGALTWSIPDRAPDVPLGSRLILLASAISLICLTGWLLLASSGRVFDGWQSPFSWIVEFGGYVGCTALLLIMLIAGWRLRTGLRRFKRRMTDGLGPPEANESNLLFRSKK
jgi:hypothetical protein